MVLKQDLQRSGRTDISDFCFNYCIILQPRNYLNIALFVGFIFSLPVATYCFGSL